MALAKSPESPPVFYMTCETNRSRIEDIAAQTPTMHNITPHASGSGLRPLSTYGGRYVVDSGGYSAMDRYGGDPPWTILEYHDWLTDAHDRDPFDWAAAPDFACEPAFDDIMSVEERITATVDRTIRLLDHDPTYPVLPVLQGRTVDGWVRSYDLLTDHGIPCEYVGVGTLCRLSSDRRIVETERAVRARTGVKAIHGFGVKISSASIGASFESADSQAWSWPVKFGEKYTVGENGLGSMGRTDMSDSSQAMRESYEAYYHRAVDLFTRSLRDYPHEQATVGHFAKCDGSHT